MKHERQMKSFVMVLRTLKILSCALTELIVRVTMNIEVLSVMVFRTLLNSPFRDLKLKPVVNQRNLQSHCSYFCILCH